MKVYIGSGWYLEEANSEKVLLALRKRWLEMIIDEFSPELVVIVDNDSPVRDPLQNLMLPELIHIRLPKNNGRSKDTQEKFCGWSQSFLISSSLPASDDGSHYVYVEQDCWYSRDSSRSVKKIFSDQRHVVLGHGLETPYPIQQSIFSVPPKKIEKFRFRFQQIPFSDNKMSPELKFVWAGSVFPIRMLIILHALLGTAISIAKKVLGREENEIEFWPTSRGLIIILSTIRREKMAQGRSRPLNWNRNPMIAQQLTLEETKLLLD